MAGAGEKIVVALRARPCPAESLGAWKFEENALVDTETDNIVCVADQAFGQASTTEQLFGNVGKAIVKGAMEGINGTIFAYGQTGSGKTHTMLGSGGSPGIVQLCFQEIFRHIEEDETNHYMLRFSIFELYNEKYKDLLTNQRFDLKHDFDKGTREDRGWVPKQEISLVLGGDTQERMGQVERMLEDAMKQRSIAATSKNSTSSRAHTIFRVNIESIENGDASNYECLKSTLNLVDLAGSENAKSANTTGKTQKEGGHINKSLFHLSKAISDLGEGGNVIWRNSPLLKLLKSSIDGSARTAIVCCISFEETNREQTVSTAGFATRAKKIKCHARVNKVATEKAEIAIAFRERDELRREIETMKADRRERDEQLERLENLNRQLLASKLVVDKQDQAPRRKPRLDRRKTWCPGSSGLSGVNLFTASPAQPAQSRGVRRLTSSGVLGTPQRVPRKSLATSAEMPSSGRAAFRGRSASAVTRPNPKSQQLLQMESLLEQQTDTVERLLDQKDALEKVNERNETQLAKLEGKIQSINLARDREMNQLRETHAEDMKALSARHEEDMEFLNTEIEAFQNASPARRKSSSSMHFRLRVQQLEAKLVTLNQELEETKTLLSREQEKFSESETAALHAKLADQSAALEAAAGHASTVQEQKELISFLEDTIKRVQEKKPQFGAANDQQANHAEEVAELHAAVEQLTAELAAQSQAHSTETEALKAEHLTAEQAWTKQREQDVAQELQAAVEELGAQHAQALEQAEVERAAMQSKFELLETTHAELKVQLGDTLAQLDETSKALVQEKQEGVHVESQVLNAQAEREAAVQALEATHAAALSELKAEYEAALEAHAAQRLAAEQELQSRDTDESRLQAKETEIAILTQQVTALTAKLQESREYVEATRTELKAVQDEATRAQAQLAETTQELAFVSAEHTRSKGSIEELRAKVIDADKKLIASSAELAKARTALGKVEKELSTAKAEQPDEAAAEQLVQANTSLRASVMALKSELEQRDEQLRLANAQVEQLQESHSSLLHHRTPTKQLMKRMASPFVRKSNKKRLFKRGKISSPFSASADDLPRLAFEEGPTTLQLMTPLRKSFSVEGLDDADASSVDLAPIGYEGAAVEVKQLRNDLEEAETVAKESKQATFAFKLQVKELEEQLIASTKANDCLQGALEDAERRLQIVKEERVEEVVGHLKANLEELSQQLQANQAQEEQAREAHERETAAKDAELQQLQARLGEATAALDAAAAAEAAGQEEEQVEAEAEDTPTAVDSELVEELRAAVAAKADELADEVAAREAAAAAHQEQMAALSLEFEAAEKASKAAAAAYEQEVEAMQGEIAAKAAELATATEAHAAEVAAHEQRAAALGGELEDARLGLEDARQEIELQLGSLASLFKIAEAAKLAHAPEDDATESDGSVAQFAEETIALLDQRLRVATESLGAAEAAHTTGQGALDELQGEVRALTAELEAARAEAAARDGSASEDAAKLASLEARCNDMQAVELELEEARAAYTEARSELDGVVQRLDDATQGLAEAKAEIEHLSMVKAGMEEELGEVDLHTRTKMAALEQQLEAATSASQAGAASQAEQALLQGTLEQLQADNQQLRGEADALRKELELVSEQEQGYEEQIQTLQTLIDEQEQEVSSAEADKARAGGQVEKLRDALKEAYDSMENLQRETTAQEETTEAHVAGLEAQLAAMRAEHSALAEERGDAEGHALRAALEAECRGLRAEVEAQRERLERAQQEVQRLGAAAAGLEATRDELQEALKEAEAQQADQGGGIVELSAFYAVKAENDLLKRENLQLKHGKGAKPALQHPEQGQLPGAPTSPAPRAALKALDSNTPPVRAPAASKAPLCCSLKNAPETPSARLQEEMPDVQFRRSALQARKDPPVFAATSHHSQRQVKQPAGLRLGGAGQAAAQLNEGDEPGECATQ